LTPEVVGILVATLVFAVLFSRVLALTLSLALVFCEEANDCYRTDPKQGKQGLPPIHV
jgi:hypothetical protein